MKEGQGLNIVFGIMLVSSVISTSLLAINTYHALQIVPHIVKVAVL